MSELQKDILKEMRDDVKQILSVVPTLATKEELAVIKTEVDNINGVVKGVKWVMAGIVTVVTLGIK